MQLLMFLYCTSSIIIYKSFFSKKCIPINDETAINNTHGITVFMNVK